MFGVVCGHEVQAMGWGVQPQLLAVAGKQNLFDPFFGPSTQANQRQASDH